jgi:type I restriction enzyme S subunit
VQVPYWPHDTTLWVKDFKGNFPAFVARILDYLDLARFDAATSVPTLNRNAVHDLRISFPPLAEQRKIALILSTWDEAIALVEALIAALKRRKQGLMQRLLTGEVRFPGFAKSDEYVHTKFGMIPADWNLVELQQIGTVNEVMSVNFCKKGRRALPF